MSNAHLLLKLPPEQGIFLHQLLELLGISLGAYYYRWLKRKNSQQSIFAPGNFAVVLGCLIGAGLGNKALFWLEHPQHWNQLFNNPLLIFQGQSIVGGLLGGLLGVELSKKFAGVSISTGDLFVGPILVGLAIGRLGCFFAGLNDETFGIPTQLPWGVDFGDGTARHPTQLYEIIFVLWLWWLLEKLKPTLAREPGLTFKIMFSSYLVWRLLIDFLKPIPFDFGLGMGGIQWLCLVALVAYLPFVWLAVKRWNNPLHRATQ